MESNSLTEETAKWSANQWANFWYYEIGVNPIPADSKEKKPLEKWTNDSRGNWQIESLPEDIFKAWKSEAKYERGIAIICGKIFRGKYKDFFLVMVDCDNKLAIDAFTLKNGAVNVSGITMVEQHANKEKAHFYFIVEKPIPAKAPDSAVDGKKIPKIEVKSGGKMISYCAGGHHKDGSKIEIIGTKIPKQLEANNLYLQLKRICDKYDLAYGNSISDVKPSNDKPTSWDLQDKDIEKGVRHNSTLTYLEGMIGRAKNAGDPYTKETFVDFALWWNKYRAKPPRPEDEFMRDVTDAWIYTHKDETDPEAPDAKTYKITKDNRNKLILKIAKKIMDKYDFVFENGVEILWIYHEGIYVQGEAKKLIIWEIESMVPTANQSFVREIIAKIERRNILNSEDFDTGRWIAAPNGHLDLSTGILHEATPRRYLKRKIPWDYYKYDKRPQMIYDFILSCHQNDTNMIFRMLQQMASPLVDPEIKLDKMIVNHGPRGTGKTTWAELVEFFYGSANVGDSPLSKMQNDDNHIIKNRDKMINFDRDMSAKDIDYLNLIKSMISHEAIDVRGIYSLPTKVRFMGILMGNANHLFTIKDEDQDAFLSRVWINSWTTIFRD